MKQPIRKKSFNPASLQRPRTARTLLLRMAADEERAARVRELYETRKGEDPRFTWRAIAEHVGVSERAAHAWGKTGGINPEHLPKLAEVLQADQDYIWRGPRERETPNLLEVTARADQVDGGFQEFRDYVATMLDEIREIKQLLAQRVEHDKNVEARLAEQHALLEQMRATVTNLGLDGDTSLDDRLATIVRDLALATLPPRESRSKS